MLHILAKYQTPDCVCFPSCSVKYALCFIIRYLMTSWHVNIWKVKIWLSQEQKELSKWKRKVFLFSKVLSSKHTKQTSKNVVEINTQEIIRLKKKRCFRIVQIIFFIVVIILQRHWFFLRKTRGNSRPKLCPAFECCPWVFAFSEIYFIKGSVNMLWT